MNRRILLSGVAATVLVALGFWAGHAAAEGSHTGGTAQWLPQIASAAQRFGISVRWIEAVMRAESGGRAMRSGAPIVSVKGAMGLMQLMPATYEEMRQRYGLGGDPFHPFDNILAGTAYLRETFDRFGYPGLFAAYNCGPDRYAASLSGRALPAETKAYLSTVLAYLDAGPAIPDSILIDMGGPPAIDPQAVGPSVFVPLVDN